MGVLNNPENPNIVAARHAWAEAMKIAPKVERVPAGILADIEYFRKLEQPQPGTIIVLPYNSETGTMNLGPVQENAGLVVGALSGAVPAGNCSLSAVVENEYPKSETGHTAGAVVTCTGKPDFTKVAADIAGMWGEGTFGPDNHQLVQTLTAAQRDTVPQGQNQAESGSGNSSGGQPAQPGQNKGILADGTYPVKNKQIEGISIADLRSAGCVVDVGVKANGTKQAKVDCPEADNDGAEAVQATAAATGSTEETIFSPTVPVATILPTPATTGAAESKPGGPNTVLMFIGGTLVIVTVVGGVIIGAVAVASWTGNRNKGEQKQTETEVKEQPVGDGSKPQTEEAWGGAKIMAGGKEIVFYRWQDSEGVWHEDSTTVSNGQNRNDVIARARNNSVTKARKAAELERKKQAALAAVDSGSPQQIKTAINDLNGGERTFPDELYYQTSVDGISTLGEVARRRAREGDQAAIIFLRVHGGGGSG